MQKIQYFFSRLAFSKTLLGKRTAQKITYMALTTALCAVVNIIEPWKNEITTFSLTLFISGFAGLLLGGVSGFFTCFLGDLIGFLIKPVGIYAPWIGICNGLTALFVAWCLLLPKAKKFLPVYPVFACLLGFVFCTCGLNTWYLKGLLHPDWSYFEYLRFRLFVSGQIWNSVFNAILTVAVLPIVVKVKPLGIKV